MEDTGQGPPCERQQRRAAARKFVLAKGPNDVLPRGLNNPKAPSRTQQPTHRSPSEGWGKVCQKLRERRSV